ncbi:hypothetical protein [Solibacillus cecembensis]|uniref:hypothetical protein n=1 Tax=Solibacillus cecembensis TaxID=459347 RepID=UPI003D0275AA
MKEKIKSYEQFEQRLKQEAVRIESLEKPAMSKERSIRTSKKLRIAPSLLIALFVITLSGTVVIAMEWTGLHFFNNGKSVFEMTEMNEDEAASHFSYDELMGKNRSLLDRIHKEVPEGKFITFLDVETYEALGISAVTNLINYKEFKSFSEMPLEFFAPLNFKESVNGTYLFENAQYYYEFPEESLDAIIARAEEMYKEALQLNVPYITKERELSNEIDQVRLDYQGLNDKFNLEIWVQTIGEGMSTTQDLSSYVQLNENGLDYYYSEFQQQLYFVYERQEGNLLVSIRNTLIYSEKISLKELLEISNAIIP